MPRPTSTLGKKPSERYRALGMKTVLMWKSPDMEKGMHCSIYKEA
jgi:hypothetical protein